ncbi:MAG TPA: LysR substrate-binding domain-containing protein [Bacteriovoracaceae bacterium]|nr:LysR substrate-binding domain-containing protein [Bacteriovoracaceae bacterium]
MTLTQLNYLIAVDRCRNFAQAAKECFVTQPTLSMQIQKLEDYLQIIVFDRGHTPVVPTPMGKKVLEYAKKVMQGAQELEELSKSLRGEISGEYHLSVIPTLAPYVLPLFVQKFVDEYPAVELRIYEHQTDEIIRFLKDGKIDGAILATPLDEKDLVEDHLFFEPFRIFLTPDHDLLKKKSIDQKDLNSSEAWLLKEGHCLRSQALQLCQVKKDAQEKQLYFEAGSLETLVNMVKATKGFTVLPYLSCLNLSELDKNSLRDFKGPAPVREISFVTGPHSMKKSIEKALIKTIAKHLPKGLKKSDGKAEVIPIL